MPWEALGEMAAAVRRVARLLLTLISTLESGFEKSMQARRAAMTQLLAKGWYFML